MRGVHAVDFDPIQPLNSLKDNFKLSMTNPFVKSVLESRVGCKKRKRRNPLYKAKSRKYRGIFEEHNPVK